MTLVPMDVPGVGQVLLPKGTLFCPVSPALMDALGDDPEFKTLKVRLYKTAEGLVEFQFMTEAPAPWQPGGSCPRCGGGDLGVTDMRTDRYGRSHPMGVRRYCDCDD